MSLITGTDLDDTLSGTSGDDTIQGLGGADSLNGQDGRDLLFGGAGNDRLNGGDLTGSVGVSDDTLDGGAGDDVLFGRRGSDDYRFSSGFGQDEILDNSAASDERDRIVFDATVGRPDILVTTIFDQTSTSDLLLTSTVDGSSIFLDDFISGDELENGVREIVFADGTVLALDAGLLLNGGDVADDMGSADQADTLDGGGGDDRLNGMGGADLLIGGAGDDTLSGGNRQNFLDSSNDTLIGGTGNDIMIGRGGDDDFVFSIGFGQDEIRDSNAADGDRDRIVFDPTVGRLDILVTTIFDQTSTSDLLLTSTVDGSSIFLDDFISGNDLENGVREIVFADGTVLALDTGLLLNGGDGADDMGSADQADTLDGGGGDDRLNGMGGADLLIGGAGDDTLSGGNRQNFLDSSNDTLIGGTGNDIMIGRGGDDDFVFSTGFGQDEIRDSNAANGDRDRIVFDATIDPSDIRLVTVFDQTRTSDFFIFHDVDGSSIFLDDFISGDELENGVREIVFADGTVLALDAGLLLNGGDGADDMGSADQADTLDGGGGDDRLNGMGGADLLIGGAGDDTLSGGNRQNFLDSSNDTLIGGTGNDLLIGRGGDDDFVFSVGFGQDEILNSNAANGDRDRIVFDATIHQADIHIRTVNIIGNVSGDLVLEHVVDGSTVTVTGLIDNGGLENGVRVIAFADGTVIDLELGFAQEGTAGNDTLVGLSGADILRGLEGNDRLNGVFGADRLFGGAGDDTLDGGAVVNATDSSDDTLLGGAGDDRLTGRGGDDTFVFGDGDGADTVVDFTSGDVIDLRGVLAISEFSDVQARLSQSGADAVIDLGDGDSILLLGVSVASLSASDFLLDPDNATRIVGTEGDDLLIGDSLDNTIDGLGGNDTIDGALGSDLLVGGIGNDAILGETGADTLLGGGDADTLTGSDGDDLLDGGTGNDTYLFSAGFGLDVIVASDAGLGEENRLFFDASINKLDIRLKSFANPDDLGASLVIRHDLGNGEITISDFYDATPGAGFGTLRTGFEILEFADGTIIDLRDGLVLGGESQGEHMRGTSLDDKISSAGGGDEVEGFGGADSLFGASEDDTLDGGDGNDEIFGGADNDSLFGGDGDDLLEAGLDADTLTGGNGNDRFVFVETDGADVITDFQTGDRIDLTRVSSVGRFAEVLASATQVGSDVLLDLGAGDSITLLGVSRGDLVDTDFLLDSANGSGPDVPTEGDDLLIGDTSDNQIDGLGGNDTILGSDGDDTLNGSGGEDQLFGGTGGDSLFGGGGSDTLEGGAGNDELSGAGGEDTYVFGAGFGADEVLILGASGPEADRLFFDASIDRADIRLFSVADPFDLSADLFIQDDADGSTILVSDFYNPNRGGSFGQLRSGFEILEFADGTTIDLRQGFELVGGDGADHMRGPNLNDQLFGLGGADTLEGRNGNDDLFGGDGADELQGGSGDDELFGGAGDDVLFGEGDADTLEGGLGDDTLIGAGGNDTYVFSAGFGADEILSLDASGLEQDRLLFDASIDRADIRLFSVADPFDLSADLFIQDDADGSSILIADFYNPNPGGSFGRLRAGFELLEFADGTIVELRQGLELIGSEDADFMRGPDRDDQLLGLGGDDTLEGHIGDDSLFGGDGGDALLGSSGNDLISGDTGHDTLNGEAGDDTLNGGAGADSLAGGAGDDLFILEAGDGADRIADFAAGALSEDRLDVSALGFTRFQDVQAVATDGAEGVTLALGSGTSVLLEGVLATELDADDLVLAEIDTEPVQRIDPAVDAFIVGAGGQIVVTGVYSTANPVDETLTGIGIRVHFDSSVLQFDGLENLFQPALQPFGQVVEADSSDFDDDAATDSFVALNWADFGGQFPGVGTTPLDLFDILFTGLGDPSDSGINFSASSLALDRNFASTSVDVAADRWPLPDIVSVAENSADGTLIADLAPIPIDPIDPGSFTLLDDAGGRFVLDGFVLRVADGDGLDFEDDASHDISLRITNNAGGSVDRALTVDLTDVNEAPTVVSIDSADIDEDAEAGDQVGTLSALDPEGDIIGFSLIDDAGGRFALDGERLVVAGSGLDFETAPGHSITVRATDAGGLSLDQVLDISVNDVAEATLDLDGDGQVNALTDGLIALGELFGAPLSQLAGLAEPGSPGSDTLVLGDLLDQARAEIFDVDGDGTTDALTDGLMILGHLFGAPQDQVAAFAQPGAIRTDPAEIAAFLDSFVPVEA